MGRWSRTELWGRLGRRLAGLSLVVPPGLVVGCAAPSDGRPGLAVPDSPQPQRVTAPSGVRAVSFTDGPLPAPRPVSPQPGPPARPQPPFDLASELTAEGVVARVLARNPTLAQMAAAAEAAAARYPQVTSLDDPTFGASVAPGAWGSNELNGGYRLEASQKLPFPGKRALRGANALAEARAAGNEVEDTRLQLAEAAAAAFFDYYAVERALEVNRESLRLLGEFKQTAETRYKTGTAPQQDVIQADVEAGKQRERQVTLDRVREVAVARINTLMHLPPDAPLPPPPRTVPAPAPLPDTPALREAALARRPDLIALADRVAAELAAVGLARKEFGPDVEVTGAYDTFWQETPLRAQVGLRVNLPVRTTRRYAALAEAQAKVAQRQAELARATDRVNFEVQEAAAQVRESGRVVRLYEADILPAAELNVKSARAAYTAGQVPFLTLVEAQRNAVELRDRYYETVAAYGRRLASLGRVVGGTLPASPSPTHPPPAPRPEPEALRPPSVVGGPASIDVPLVTPAAVTVPVARQLGSAGPPEPVWGSVR
jgi:outer membrane protein TolC